MVENPDKYVIMLDSKIDIIKAAARDSRDREIPGILQIISGTRNECNPHNVKFG